MGMRPADDKVLPLCHECHINIQHRIGEERFYKDVYKALELAKALYLLSGDTYHGLALIAKFKPEVFECSL